MLVVFSWLRVVTGVVGLYPARCEWRRGRGLRLYVASKELKGDCAGFRDSRNGRKRECVSGMLSVGCVYGVG